MEAPKTKEEAQKYVGKKFVLNERGMKESNISLVLATKSDCFVCLHAGLHVLTVRVHSRYSYSGIVRGTIWKYIELFEECDIKGVKDLLDHWD